LESPDVSLSLQLYNYFEDDTYVYLVLEMCHNGELYSHLKTNGEVLNEDQGSTCNSAGFF